MDDKVDDKGDDKVDDKADDKNVDKNMKTQMFSFAERCCRKHAFVVTIGFCRQLCRQLCRELCRPPFWIRLGGWVAGLSAVFPSA